MGRIGFGVKVLLLGSVLAGLVFAASMTPARSGISLRGRIFHSAGHHYSVSAVRAVFAAQGIRLHRVPTPKGRPPAWMKGFVSLSGRTRSDRITVWILRRPPAPARKPQQPPFAVGLGHPVGMARGNVVVPGWPFYSDAVDSAIKVALYHLQ